MNLHFCLDDVLQRSADAAVVSKCVVISNPKRSKMQVVMILNVRDNTDLEEPLGAN